MCNGMNMSALNYALLFFSADVRGHFASKLSGIELHSYFKLIRRSSSHYFEEMIKPYLVLSDVTEMDETYVGLTKFSVTDNFPAIRWIYGLFERKTKLSILYYLKQKTHENVVKIIKRHCKLGSTLMSDMHSLYTTFGSNTSKLTQYGYYHMWANHSETMVHYKFRFLHSLNMESEWLQLKKRFATIAHA